MFLGHYGLAFALKRAEPKVSLGTLFLAAQLVDLAWGATILLGWEVVAISPGVTAATPLRFLSYPITHSLLAAVLWALRALAPTRPRAAGAAAGLLAGAVGAVGYTLACAEISYDFVATWYTFAMSLVAGVGALSGRWILRI